MLAKGLIVASLTLLAGLAIPAISPAAVETTVASENFVVHYMSGGSPPSSTPVTPAIAQQVSVDAEAALAFYKRIGFPAPLSDATMPQLPGRRTVRLGAMRWAPPWWDGKIDVYIARLGGGLLGRAVSGTQGVPAAPGIFIVDYRAGGRTTAHELFHLIEFTIYRRSTLDILLGEALANWGAFRFSFQGAASARPLGTVGPASLKTPWASLDCRSNCGYAGRRGGYDQWPFFQYLSERFGDAVIRQIIETSAALGAADRKPHGFESISGALKPHGSSLKQAFAAFTAARLDGSFKHPLLAGTTMTPNTRLVAGKRRGSIQLAVGHLAARTIVLRARGRCGPRRVKLTVTGPEHEAFAVRLGRRARRLKHHGSSSSLVTTVKACNRLGSRLALANLASSGPEQNYVVSARVLG